MAKKPQPKPQPKMTDNESQALKRLIEGLNKVDGEGDYEWGADGEGRRGLQFSVPDLPKIKDYQREPASGEVVSGDPSTILEYFGALNQGKGPMTDTEMQQADNHGYFQLRDSYKAARAEPDSYQPTEADILKLQDKGIFDSRNNADPYTPMDVFGGSKAGLARAKADLIRDPAYGMKSERAETALERYNGQDFADEPPQTFDQREADRIATLIAKRRMR